MSLDTQAVLRDAKWLLENITRPPTALLIEYADEHEIIRRVIDWNFCENTKEKQELGGGQKRKRIEINAKILFALFGPNTTPQTNTLAQSEAQPRSNEPRAKESTLLIERETVKSEPRQGRTQAGALADCDCRHQRRLEKHERLLQELDRLRQRVRNYEPPRE